MDGSKVFLGPEDAAARGIQHGDACILKKIHRDIDIAGEQPKALTTDAVELSEVVITMGCGDACPFFPGKRYEDWQLEDPAGQGIESVRVIRDEIRQRVEALLSNLAQ